MRTLDFIIVGERRCVTTSLFNMLSSHPEVILPKSSDINYFIENSVAIGRSFVPGVFSEQDYWKDHSQAGLMALFEGLDKGVLGIKAPDTFYYEKAHGRLKQLVNDDTKFIVILRDPVERAFSHYWLDYAKGREPESLPKAFELEELRIQQSDYAKDHYSYQSRGFYIDSLEKWYRSFSKESTLVVLLDDLKADPQNEWVKIQDFLDLNKHPYRTFEESNKNIAMTLKKGLRSFKPIFNSYEELVFRLTTRLKLNNEAKVLWRNRLRSPFFESVRTYEKYPQLKAELRRKYLPSIEQLEAYLNKDLTKWK